MTAAKTSTLRLKRQIDLKGTSQWEKGSGGWGTGG
jgi:hypothetical protein